MTPPSPSPTPLPIPIPVLTSATTLDLLAWMVMIVQMATALGVLVTAVTSFLTLMRQHTLHLDQQNIRADQQNLRQDVHTIKVEINSHMKAFVEKSEQLAQAQGVAAGTEAERERVKREGG